MKRICKRPKRWDLKSHETRSYQGWYRHITLVRLASAFLVSICLQTPHSLPTPAADPQPDPRPRSSHSLPPKDVICWLTSSSLRPPRPPSSVTGRFFGEPTTIGLATIIVAVAKKLVKSSLSKPVACSCQDFSWHFFGENSQEFSSEVVRLVLVLVAHHTRKE